MSAPDEIRRFHLINANVRGHLVQLESAWLAIRANMDCPPVASALLGESLAAAALLAGALKFDGRLSIQLGNAGPLKLLFAECSSDGSLRGLARWDEGADIGAIDLGSHKSVLAITVENVTAGSRHQGQIPVRSDHLSAVLEDYFDQSEQLPTRMLLVAQGDRCAGIMLQKLATASGCAGAGDADAWNFSGHLLATLTDAELLSLPAEKLLSRLFHEQDVHLEPGRHLQFRCSCSKARVEEMLRGLGSEEAIAAVSETGSTTITCEFCNRTYTFDGEAIRSLFPIADRQEDAGQGP